MEDCVSSFMSAPSVKLDKVGQIGIFDAIFGEKKDKRQNFQRFSYKFCQKKWVQTVHQFASVVNCKTNETIVNNFIKNWLKFLQKYRKM